MIKKCDIALIVKSEKKNKIRIHRGDIDIAIKVPKVPPSGRSIQKHFKI